MTDDRDRQRDQLLSLLVSKLDQVKQRNVDVLAIMLRHLEDEGKVMPFFIDVFRLHEEFADLFRQHSFDIPEDQLAKLALGDDRQTAVMALMFGLPELLRLLAEQITNPPST